MPLKEPLTPTRLFTANKGRTLTAPFIGRYAEAFKSHWVDNPALWKASRGISADGIFSVGFVVTMFYFGTNIVWPTMVSVYFTNANTPAHTVYWLATVQGKPYMFDFSRMIK